MNPIVSIIIPVFNRQDLVKDALDSVLAQSYQNWECIVVDDGSTDETWKVLEEYAQKDKRIKIHKRNREPKGAPTCRNIGAEQSKSDLLMFWDSDDIMAPWCVEERINFMIDNPELDFGLFQLLHVSSNNEGFLRCFIGEDDYLKRFLSFKTTWGTHAVIWRKMFFNSLGGWDESAKIWQDGEIHIRALLKNPNYGWGSSVPNGVVRFGIDEHSISTTSKPIETLQNRLAVIIRIKTLLGHNYKHIFSKSIRARLWLETYTFSMNDKLVIMNSAYKNGIITKYELSKYLYTYQVYNVIKRIPLMRRVYYRLLIEPNFKGYEFWKVERVENNVKDELLRKVRLLKLENAFRKQIELSLKN